MHQSAEPGSSPSFQRRLLALQKQAMYRSTVEALKRGAARAGQRSTRHLADGDDFSTTVPAASRPGEAPGRHGRTVRKDRSRDSARTSSISRSIVSKTASRGLRGEPGTAKRAGSTALRVLASQLRHYGSVTSLAAALSAGAVQAGAHEGLAKSKRGRRSGPLPRCTIGLAGRTLVRP